MLNIYLRKTHLQIGATVLVWGGGMLMENGTFVPIAIIKKSGKFIVKEYKFFSIVTDARR